MAKINNVSIDGYFTPELMVLNVAVENGYLTSDNYGDVGEAGQPIENENFGEF